MIENGTIIGNKYMVDCSVGVGGMANVYKAHSIADNQVVAIKVLKDEYKDDAQFLRRFDHEARAGLTLSHKNIVRSIEVGVHNDVSYIVFEYIDGKTLKDYIRRNGAFTPKIAVSIVSQVLSALECAHSLGIIHRDVKPQNVMITSDGVVKLADFGIARVTAATTKTFGGSSGVMGSVHYISPEQVRGDEVTIKSDLYSVGIMLYELLTGEVPFDGENSISVALNHLNTPIVPPMEINPDIPPALNDVIIKATSKNPDFRYESAVLMQQDLKKALKEPNSRFALLDIDDSLDSEGDEKTPKPPVTPAARRLYLGLVLVLCLIVMAFIIITANYNKTHIFVPNLVGKDFSTAQKMVKDDFELFVSSRVASDEYPEGYILTQTPTNGTKADVGSKISVTVTINGDNTIVPNLTDMTLLEAGNALERAGLSIESIVYDEKSTRTAGLIFNQEPLANEEVKRGSGVVIYISGENTETEKMPSLIDRNMTAATETLKSFGFTHIIVRFSEVNPETGDSGESGVVFAQNVNAGLSIDKGTTIQLSVFGKFKGKYSGERAFNLSVPDNNTPVMITMVTTNGYEVVLFEATMDSGTQVAAYTVYSDETGTFELVAYVGDSEQKRDSVTFNEE